MIKFLSSALILAAASAASAQETRQLSAHEHGVGQLDIAFEQGQIAMALRAPGADIVGFEHAAVSAQDRAKVDAAVATLARPLDLFVVPEAAGCTVVEASASLESEDHHEAQAVDAHTEDEHDHNEHREHAHDDHDHGGHAEAAGHTEFHATYLLKCSDAEAASVISFAYFDVFPNALELEIQVVTEKGATAFEVARDAPQLDLRDMF
ncbi:MAG: DUF2796 domain-containing protein [Pseudomonadota bacterium]